MNEEEILNAANWAIKVNEITSEISGENVNINKGVLQGLLDLYNQAKSKIEAKEEVKRNTYETE